MLTPLPVREHPTRSIDALPTLNKAMPPPAAPAQFPSKLESLMLTVVVPATLLARA